MARSVAGKSTRRWLFLISLAAAALLATGCVTFGNERSHVATGNQLARDGLLREAVEAYKKALAEDARNVVAHRNLGMVLVKMGDYKRAVRHLEKAMRRYERDFDANFYLGEAYRAQDRYADAIFRYKRALTLRPNDGRALKPLAWSYFKIRYYSEALNTARQLQKVAADDDQTAIILSRTLLKLKRTREALAILKTAKRQIPRASRPYYNSVEGDILYEMNDADGAAKAYREALREQPLLAGALLGLGKCLMDKGQTKLAISYMERAVRIRPRLTEAHYLLGKAHETTDRNRALRYYQHFRRQASADPEFIGHLNEVKQRISALQTPTKAVR